MEYSVERAKAAMNYLAGSTYYAQTWRKIVANAAKPRSEPFDGEQEVLNELVKMGRQNPKVLDNLYEVLKTKRHDKNDYQREFMAAKRRRDGKAIKLEERVTGRSMSLSERRAFLLEKYSGWHTERDLMLAVHRSAGWEERNALIRDFWAAKEKELDDQLGK